MQQNCRKKIVLLFLTELFWNSEIFGFKRHSVVYFLLKVILVNKIILGFIGLRCIQRNG